MTTALPLERHSEYGTPIGGKDTVTGSGITFNDRGAYDLKGVPGQWRLYAVAANL